MSAARISICTAGPNQYHKVRASPHPPDAGLLMETFPDPRTIEDDGIRDRRVDAALHGFLL